MTFLMDHYPDVRVQVDRVERSGYNLRLHLTEETAAAALGELSDAGLCVSLADDLPDEEREQYVDILGGCCLSWALRHWLGCDVELGKPGDEGYRQIYSDGVTCRCFAMCGHEMGEAWTAYVYGDWVIREVSL